VLQGNKQMQKIAQKKAKNNVCWKTEEHFAEIANQAEVRKGRGLWPNLVNVYIKKQ
jgi:hypothetical protein